MPLTPALLATELDTQVQNAATEPPARAALALAWTNYFYNATSNGVPVTPGSLAGAQAAMDAALTGMSATGAGAAALQSGITAFWTTIVGTPAAIFVAATLITPPPTLAGIAAAVQPVFASNTMPGVTKTQALNAIATVLHANGRIGGTATFPGPVVAPIL